MVDVFSAAKRSRIMRAVRSDQTTPERVVVEIVRRLRFRPRLNDKTLPGSPDLSFPRRRKVVFIHGCFWHRHSCVAGQSTPASNQPFWLAKFARNGRRDRRVRRELRRLGWHVLVVWECQTSPAQRKRLTARLAKFLGAARH